MSINVRLPLVVGEAVLARMASAAEQVLFMRGAATDNRNEFDVVDVLELTPADMSYEQFHVDLTDEARQRVLVWATESGDMLLEAHSHGHLGDPSAFSILDIEGLRDWVSHVRWRLGNRPYAALVFGRETFDGLAWLDGTPVQVDCLEIGPVVLQATGRSLQRWGSNS